MSQIKILAYFNKKKCQFSIEALEGKDKGRVIAYKREIILKDCKFSKNKDKTAGIIGVWDSMSNSLSQVDGEIHHYFGGKKDKDGWSPIYATEDIKYDFDSQQYIVDDEDEFWDLDPEIQSQINNDEKFKKPALDNAGLIYLEIDSDAFDGVDNPKHHASENEPTIYDQFSNPPEICDEPDQNIISGVACYWRKNEFRKPQIIK